ncbi:transcription initiation factor TFIID subunit 10, partial [Tremellales sp. Uapishka_1]
MNPEVQQPQRPQPQQQQQPLPSTHLTNGTSHAGPSSPSSAPLTQGPDMTQLFQARKDEEAARRDRSLAEFLVMLDGYKPMIPEEVTEYYLQRSGFDCSDPRLKRLLALSAQKFVSDLAADAFHFAKLRTNGTAAGRGRPNAGDKSKVVLTMDDLSLALGEHGVNVKKPDYYL